MGAAEAGVPPNERGPTIRLDEVSVRFRIPHENLQSLKEYAIRALRNRLTYEEFWAVRRVTLEVRPGEVLGLVGRNGAGKSTLLKLIARVLRPTEGRVRTWGRVAPLLDYGAGFHPDLTGRENLYLNGTLLGLSHRALDASFDHIVDFAELAPFIDAPGRTYSSGMVARLGFAIATEQRPDVLLMDEVLAVGDHAFQTKCEERFEAFRSSGTAIVLVSHDKRLVATTCQRALWLEHGAVRQIGPAAEVVAAYAGPG
jgi:ABC-2 type transport system ATP-binding protein/lipopolysaccharide transport system ATP-binding protein